jgi:hypothetical protein
MFFRQADPTGSLANRYSLGPLTPVLWLVRALWPQRPPIVERRIAGRDRRRPAHAM